MYLLKIGSWAGNVMIQHEHNEFPSDICTLLETCNAVIKVYDIIADNCTSHSVYGSNGIMNVNMENKVIAIF